MNYYKAKILEEKIKRLEYSLDLQDELLNDLLTYSPEESFERKYIPEFLPEFLLYEDANKIMKTYKVAMKKAIKQYSLEFDEILKK